MRHTFALDNGLSVIVKEDHRAPVVSTQLWYHVGASYEYPGQSGLSHALEHLLFSGSSKLPEGQYSRLLQRMGASANAFTSEDATVFHQLLPAARLEPVLEIASDTMHTATLAAQVFTREIEVVKAERSLRVDHMPAARLHEAVTAQGFAHSSYRTPTIGTAVDLASMTVTDLQHWYRNWYAPNNATLVVCGDVQASAVKILVERHFGTLARSQLPVRKRPQEPDGFGQRSLTLKLPQASPTLSLAFNVPSHGTSTEVRSLNALRLTRFLLAEGIGSRLFSRLLRGKEVITSASADYTAYARGDQLFRITVHPSDDISATESALWGELEALKADPPSEQELARAQTKLTATQVYASDNLEYQSAQLGQLAACGLPLSLLDSQQNDLAQVRPADIQAVAQRFFVRERLTTGYLTPKENSHE